MANVVAATSASQLVGLSPLPVRIDKRAATWRYAVVCQDGGSWGRKGGGGEGLGRREGELGAAVRGGGRRCWAEERLLEGWELSTNVGVGRRFSWRTRREVAARGTANAGEEAGPMDVLLKEAGGEEVVFFDGGAHYGDLVLNLVLGLTIVWLPLTVGAIARRLLVKYRLTDRRVTVVSGLTGGEQRDFTYADVIDVVSAPRFIGEWGDIVLTLNDKTKVEMKSVPRFREVAAYCKRMAEEARQAKKAKGDKKASGGVIEAGPALGEKPRGFSS